MMMKYYLALLALSSTLIGQVWQFTTHAGSGAAGNLDGPVRQAQFVSPFGVATDRAGNVYVSDSGSHTIRKIWPNGLVSTLAGTPGVSGTTDGVGTVARFNTPSGIAMVGENLYVADTGNNSVRKVTAYGVVTTVVTGLTAPVWVTADTSRLYITEAGANVKLADMSGAVTVHSTALTNAAGLCVPHATRVVNGLLGAGNVVVCDPGNATIRLVRPSGTVQTIAGMSGQTDSIDGLGVAARLAKPLGIVADTIETMYLTDNHTVRQMSLGGQVKTLGGLSGVVGAATGPGHNLRLSSPSGITIDAQGDIYIADTGNHRIIRGWNPTALSIAKKVLVIDDFQSLPFSLNTNISTASATTGTDTQHVYGNGIRSVSLSDVTPAYSAAQLLTRNGYSILQADLVQTTSNMTLRYGPMVDLRSLGYGNVAVVLAAAPASGFIRLRLADGLQNTLGTVTLSVAGPGTYVWKLSDLITNPSDQTNQYYLDVTVGASGTYHVAQIYAEQTTPTEVRATITNTGGGTINGSVAYTGIDIPSSKLYQEGAVLSLSANPLPGYRFDSWSGTLSEGLEVNRAGINVAISRPGNLVANFIAVTPVSLGLVNLSVRATIAEGEQLVAGTFMDKTCNVLVRAVGPGLTGFGVENAMQNPNVTIYAGTRQLDSNDDWTSNSLNQLMVQTANVRAGAFPLSPGSKDAATVWELQPGSNSFVLAGTAGEALLELYRLPDDNRFHGQGLTNLSVRVKLPVNGTVIPGIVVDRPCTLLLRVAGPSLSLFGVRSPLSNPKLTVYSGTRVIASNDDWMVTEENTNSVLTAVARTGAFPLPSGSKDAALVLAVPMAGSYTFMVENVDHSPGEALVEVYLVN